MRDLGAATRDCPVAPPAQASVQARTLHRACVIVGGVSHLARQLAADVAEVDRWLRGEKPVPEAVFMLSVEIVLLYASGVGGRG